MPRPSMRWNRLALLGVLIGISGFGIFRYLDSRTKSPEANVKPREPEPLHLAYKRRMAVDTGGLLAVYDHRQPSWAKAASLDEVTAAQQRHISLYLASLNEILESNAQAPDQLLLKKASVLHSQGKAAEAYQVLKTLEAEIKGTSLEENLLYTVVYYLGVTGLRMGENDNCVMCRGESACILPIAPSAVHTNPNGSRLAIEHFSEYLRVFPDDYEVKYLLNLAHMTLGEFPDKVDPRYRLPLDRFWKPSKFGIGAFRDISHLVGIERFNESGGAIMEDFDNDGLLDIVVTDWSPAGSMAFYRNKGDGTFEDRTKAAGLEKLPGGLTCFQTDYNNDGHMDIFVPRGAWMPESLPIRPSLLRNNGNGTFTDVTKEAGLATPRCSNSASWADYDNDGYLDLFMCGAHQPCPLYRNKGDGTFEEVGAHAGLGDLRSVLGVAWIDFDNDGYPDLFVNVGTPPNALGGVAGGEPRLYRNNRNGTFTNVTKELGIDGPRSGFSCWAFDYDNDGWLDIFAASTIHSLEDIVKGMIDEPHELPAPKLYRNLGGKGFRDVSQEMGVNKVCAPMGSNFGDFDNDGYLDFYLATGNPDLSTLVPNRMFRNLGGKRFAEITSSSRTGHLQKGHAVAIGDWRRCGSQDLFVQLGGAVYGDRYHNVLFQNPGQGNNWLNVKLIGGQTKDGDSKKTNRAAIGARIKVVTAGREPLTVQRHVSTGSSFGANPLEQHIGLGKADRIARLEIFWPTSGTTQVFTDIPANQAIEITEFGTDYRKRDYKPISVPK